MTVSSRRIRTASKLAAASTAVLLALAACGGGGSTTSADPTDGTGPGPSPTDTSGGGSGQDVEISFLTHWGPDQVSALEAAATAFAETNPGVKVTVQAVPFANLLSTLRTQSGASGPTIAGIYDLWLPELAQDGIAAKAPADYASDITANWPENIVSAASNGGDVYGYPNEIDLYALNYNTKLFADAGISEPPATFDELLAVAEQLTDEANGIQGLGVITNWTSGAIHPFLSLAASNGGSLLDDSGQAALTDPKVVAVAELYQKLVDAKAIVPEMSAANANTTGPYLDNFANGKTAMIIMANWWQSALKDAMGDNYADVATTGIPMGPDGTKHSSISYSWMTVVNASASAEQQEAAWKFLQYLNGPDSGQAGSSAMADILVGMGILPSRTSDIDAHQSQLSDPFLTGYVEHLTDATPFPTFIGGDAASQALQRHVEALIFGQSTPQQAMEQATADVDAAIAAK